MLGHPFCKRPVRARRPFARDLGGDFLFSRGLGDEIPWQ